MTNIVERSSEEIYTQDLKNLLAKSAEKPENPQLLGNISNPDNKTNIEKGVKMPPLIPMDVVNSQLYTSTPKNTTRTDIHDNSTAGKSFGSNAMLDSGFYSHNGSSYINSSYDLQSTNSSINQSYETKHSEGITKLDTTKRKDSLTRSCKSRKSSPSSLSRNRLKAVAKRQSSQSFSKIQCKSEIATNISFNTPLTNTDADVDKSSKATPGSTVDELSISHYFSSSSTQTCKNLNHSTNESANESYMSLVSAYDKVSLSNRSKTNSKPQLKKSHWKDWVQMDNFDKTINKLKPPKDAYLIGSKIAIKQFDIVGNVLKQNIFDFTTKLLSYLSNEDLMSFHQVSKLWKMTLEWHPSINKVREDHVKSMRHCYLRDKENIIKKSRLSLPYTTTKNSPLHVIQKTSVDTKIKRKSQPDRHDIFQKAASQLLNHQSLMKCPLCSYASQVDGLKVLCQKATCGFEFCSKCLRSDHPFGVICPQEATH